MLNADRQTDTYLHRQRDPAFMIYIIFILETSFILNAEIFCMFFTGAFKAFDKDGDGLIKLNVLEVNVQMAGKDTELQKRHRHDDFSAHWILVCVFAVAPADHVRVTGSTKAKEKIQML